MATICPRHHPRHQLPLSLTRTQPFSPWRRSGALQMSMTPMSDPIGASLLIFAILIIAVVAVIVALLRK